MKERLNKDLGLKLLALGVSILLWIIVINMEDPVDKRVITEVPVTILHQELITNAGKTYRVADNSRKITVTVKGKKSVLRKIRVDDIRAAADFSNREGSLIPVDVSVPAYAKEVTEVTARPANITVLVEAEKTKTFPITPLTSGSLRNGYVIGELKTDPERVEISGPESVIKSISSVVAAVDVTGLSKTSELDAKLVLYDAVGTILDSTRLENNLGNEGVKVKIKVLSKKTVPVIFDTSGIEPARGFRFSGITVEPETVQVAGSKEALELIDSIEVPAEALAETGLKASVEHTIELSQYLSEGVRPVDEQVGIPVVVSIAIEKFGTRTLQVSAGSVSLINTPKGFTASCETTGNISIVITGADDKLLEQVELGPGDVYVNLVSYSRVGMYDVAVKVNLPEGVELLKDITVKVRLEEEKSGGDDG